MQEKPNLTAEKLQWLQRHDKECGGLYGVLPLCVGMPVRATDHLDRKRGILKGTKGLVVGWSEIADETPAPEGVVCNALPAVVYVKFETATSWQIPGMPDSNVYPVGPCRRVWYLDWQRKSPKLRVSRTQFPLAPQFAITAHVAQGQTIKEGVMTDLCIGPMGNPFTVYVAITCVQGRGKLLIFRPFDAAPFQKGIGLGRDLLLRHLRGDAINWQALLAKYCEERVCSTCAERKQSTAFTPGQWKRSDTDWVCRECTKHSADAGTPWQCNVCKLWHVEANFPAKHRQRQCSFLRVCLTCELKKPCFKCGVPKPEKDYGPAAWKACHADRRLFRDCVLKLRGYWSCAECLERKPHAEFTAWKENRDYRQGGTQLCNMCIGLALVCQIARRANQRLTPLRQRVQRQRHQAILEEVRKEIQQRTAERTSHALPTATGSASSTGVLAGSKAHRMNGTAPSPARTAKLPHVSTRTHVLRASNVCKAASSQGRSTHGGTVAVSFAWLQDVFALAIRTHVRRATPRWNPSNSTDAFEHSIRMRAVAHARPPSGWWPRQTNQVLKKSSCWVPTALPKPRCHCLRSLSEPARKLAFEACS